MNSQICLAGNPVSHHPHHRLQVLLMHERCGGNPDLIPILREDILAAINKHVAVDPDKVRLKIDRGEMVSLLEIDIEIPSPIRHHVERGASAVHFR